MARTIESEQIKLSVLGEIGKGINPRRAKGSSNYYIGNTKVHTRFCSTDDLRPQSFKFNINPNTLTADYELWICGGVTLYYLIPTSIMRRIYDDPDAYPDKHHPEIRVVSIDASTNLVSYKSGGGKLDLSEYRNRGL